MATYFLTFENDDDFAPVFSISGDIQGRVYSSYAPQLDGEFTIDGDLGIIIPRPKPALPLAGVFTVQGTLKAGLRTPVGVFKDFAHYPYGGIDPAMARIGATSGALTSAAAGSYNRQYAIFTAPADYPVSQGAYAWKRAAYASVGFKFANMSYNKHQLLDAVQLETVPLGATGPSTYQAARQIQVVVKPTRLNYATNPNFESGLTNYTPTGQATHAIDTFRWQGSQALKVTVPSTATSDSGLSLPVSGLIPGRQYVMSARVAIAQGCGDVAPWSGGGSVQGQKVSWRNAGEFTDPAKQRWRTVSVTFTANASSVSVGVNVLKSTMAAGVASIFWVDGMLVEEGESVRPYFDGSMGTDYLWESGGSANLSRSYFYENRIERGYLVQTLLDENTPLGITAAVPQYAVLPTQ
jgi:hypothetical protein